MQRGPVKAQLYRIRAEPLEVRVTLTVHWAYELKGSLRIRPHVALCHR
jgi:hypothetical protein